MGYNPVKHRIKEFITTSVANLKAKKPDIAHWSWSEAEAVAASNTGVHAGIILQVAGQTAPGSILADPATPRALRIKGNAAGIVGNVVISGTNMLDEAITETIVANGVAVVEGSKAFKTITQATVPARNAEADEIAIGWNDKLGLPYKLASNTVLHACHDGNREATFPTVTYSATAIESNTIDINTALNGKAVDVYLIV